MPLNISPSDAPGSMRVPRIALWAHGYYVSVGSGLRGVLATPWASEGLFSPGRRLSVAYAGSTPRRSPPPRGGGSTYLVGGGSRFCYRRHLPILSFSLALSLCLFDDLSYVNSSQFFNADYLCCVDSSQSFYADFLSYVDSSQFFYFAAESTRTQDRLLQLLRHLLHRRRRRRHRRRLRRSFNGTVMVFTAPRKA